MRVGVYEGGCVWRRVCVNEGVCGCGCVCMWACVCVCVCGCRRVSGDEGV